MSAVQNLIWFRILVDEDIRLVVLVHILCEGAKLFSYDSVILFGCTYIHFKIQKNNNLC